MEKNIRQLDDIIWQLDLRVDNETEFIAPYLIKANEDYIVVDVGCLLYTSPSPRD